MIHFMLYLYFIFIPFHLLCYATYSDFPIYLLLELNSDRKSDLLVVERDNLYKEGLIFNNVCLDWLFERS
jgi:hypothetical protein